MNKAEMKVVRGFILIRKMNARGVYYVLSKYVLLRATPIPKKSSL